LTIFASTLPLPAVFRVIDLFLLEGGIDTVFRTALAILGNSHDLLLRQNFEGVLHFLTRGGLHDK